MAICVILFMVNSPFPSVYSIGNKGKVCHVFRFVFNKNNYTNKVDLRFRQPPLSTLRFCSQKKIIVKIHGELAFPVVFVASRQAPCAFDGYIFLRYWPPTS